MSPDSASVAATRSDPLYAQLEERVLARDQKGASEVYYKLVKAGRVLEVDIAGERRLIAVEDAARYRDALGVALPQGLPATFLETAPEAAVDLVRRYARTLVPPAAPSGGRLLASLPPGPGRP